MIYNLYFQINDRPFEFQGRFDTYQEALDEIRKLIDEKSNITHTDLWRFWGENGVTYIDYGAHNARYIIEEVPVKKLEYKGYTGYVRKVVIGQSSHLCGYVIIPAGHKLLEVGWNEYETIPCHGGVTFANDFFGKGFALGFDCAHGCDIYNPKDEKYVTDEIMKMIDYIIENWEEQR